MDWLIIYLVGFLANALWYARYWVGTERWRGEADAAIGALFWPVTLPLIAVIAAAIWVIRLFTPKARR